MRSLVLRPNPASLDLLRAGVGGSRPPVAYRLRGRSNPSGMAGWTLDRPIGNQDFEEALVLAWNGEPATAAWDALLRKVGIAPLIHYQIPAKDAACSDTGPAARLLQRFGAIERF